MVSRTLCLNCHETTLLLVPENPSLKKLENSSLRNIFPTVPFQKNTIVKNCPEKLKSRKFRKSCCEISIVWWPESKGRCQLMFYRTSTQNDLRVPRKFLRFSLKLIRSMLTVCKIEYTVHWYSNDLLHNSSYYSLDLNYVTLECTETFLLTFGKFSLLDRLVFSFIATLQSPMRTFPSSGPRKTWSAFKLSRTSTQSVSCFFVFMLPRNSRSRKQCGYYARSRLGAATVRRLAATLSDEPRRRDAPGSRHPSLRSRHLLHHVQAGPRWQVPHSGKISTLVFCSKLYHSSAVLLPVCLVVAAPK